MTLHDEALAGAHDVALSGDIAYVHCAPTEGEEHVFECVIETPHSREVIYHFVMSHAYEDEPVARGRWTH